MHKKTKLENGLRVVAVPQKGTEAVTILVLIKTGTSNVDPSSNDPLRGENDISTLALSFTFKIALSCAESVSGITHKKKTPSPIFVRRLSL